MKLSKTMLGLGAAALIAFPAVAQVVATPVIAPLNGDENELGSGESVVLALVGAAAIIGGIIAASDSNDPELPISG